MSPTSQREYIMQIESLRKQLEELQSEHWQQDQLREAIAEQRLTIAALNDALGGEGSLTTDNLVRVSRLENQLAAMTQERDDRLSSGMAMTLKATIRDLTEQLAAMTAERDAAKDCGQHIDDQLAAAQAREAQLREALAFYMTPPIGQLNDHHITAAKLGVAALALPQDDSALKQYGEKVLREAAEKFRHDCDCGVPCDCYGPSTAKFQHRRMAEEMMK